MNKIGATKKAAAETFQILPGPVAYVYAYWGLGAGKAALEADLVASPSPQTLFQFDNGLDLDSLRVRIEGDRVVLERREKGETKRLKSAKITLPFSGTVTLEYDGEKLKVILPGRDITEEVGILRFGYLRFGNNALTNLPLASGIKTAIMYNSVPNVA